MADSTPKEVPWHAAYPTPKSAVASLPRHELLQWFRDGKEAGKDFALVDVRRTDFEVCTTVQCVSYANDAINSIICED